MRSSDVMALIGIGLETWRAATDDDRQKWRNEANAKRIAQQEDAPGSISSRLTALEAAVFGTAPTTSKRSTGRKK